MQERTDPSANTSMNPGLQAFIDRWVASGAAERAHKDMFLTELCDAIGVPRPDPVSGDPDADRYVFEKDALIAHEGGRISTGKIDLFKHGCFILEAKQGSEAGASKLGTAKRGTAMWALAMQEAYGQALGYAQTFDDPPPFLIVCDIGYCFDLYATFDGSKNYRDFPNAQRHRIFLRDLPQHIDTLQTIFTDPHRLDPTKYAAKVTREIAGHLAELARGLEAEHHSGETIAKFLMRCIFTMFAEDIGLLPERLFTDSLEKRWIPSPGSFQPEVESLWETMNTGGKLFGVGNIKHFDGGLFADPTALPLGKKQLERLLEASKAKWNEVEPAIFGTLLERALDPKERHSLGAHFTPRAYVERLVHATIEVPLRAEWDVVRAEVRHLVEAGKEKQAVESVRAFHRWLCQIRVLDPACGTGNFLYVTLDLFKRIESEVLGLLADLGEKQAALELEGATVTPAQFHGLEIKPWAKEIAELVLWIGYLQWQVRTRGDAGHIPEPVLRKYGNIECRDAVLAYDRIEPVLDDEGKPVTRWDGETTKKHPVTGKDVPDEKAQVPVVRYVNPRKAEWPEVEFIVGNPPFIANWKMRQALGDGYTEALRKAYPEIPETADFVMYWWDKSAALVRSSRLRRFGLITTNSLRQAFNRKVLLAHMDADPPLFLRYVIPDHPWVDCSDGAAVRISMTVGALSDIPGDLQTVRSESVNANGSIDVELQSKRGRILADLTVGANVVGATSIRANDGLACPGVKLHGSGFIVTESEARSLGLETDQALNERIRPYWSGRDITAVPRALMVIDLFGLSSEQVRSRFPAVYQWVLERVKPERDENRREAYRRNWWIFGEPRAAFRPALEGLSRYIVTAQTMKHRYFIFLDRSVLPDNMLTVFAFEDAWALGLLSSRPHTTWASAAGGTLEDRPCYYKSTCFDPFPFPTCSDSQKQGIRDLAEQLDAHRKHQQTQYPGLTLTSMYNVLAKLRSGESLTAKEKAIHEQGLISVLKQLHDDLDAAVSNAYGWPHDLADGQILERLVALNAERTEEEKNGLIRWLRPEFQNPGGKDVQIQTGFSADDLEGEVTPSAPGSAWPKALPERIAAVRDLLQKSPGSVWALRDVVSAFIGTRRKDVEAVLDSLASLGLILAFKVADGRRWRAS